MREKVGDLHNVVKISRQIRIKDLTYSASFINILIEVQSIITQLSIDIYLSYLTVYLCTQRVRNNSPLTNLEVFFFQLLPTYLQPQFDPNPLTETNQYVHPTHREFQLREAVPVEGDGREMRPVPELRPPTKGCRLRRGRFSDYTEPSTHICGPVSSSPERMGTLKGFPRSL